MRVDLGHSQFGNGRERRAPITLARIDLPPPDDEKDKAAHLAERKVVRLGRDAFENINRANTFENWLCVGRALLVGKGIALRATGANRAWGRNYSRVFGEWMERNGFAQMQKATRSVAIELAENASEITCWRDSLPEKQQRRLVHPLSVTRRWRAATEYDGKTPEDWKREATAAWKRFICCVGKLPAEDAEPLVQVARAALIGA
jgi:hypothetical protein